MDYNINLTGVIKIYLLFFVIMTEGAPLRAQKLIAANDTLQNVIAAVAANQQAKLFVHYDKNVYLPNETVWFTAYRLGNRAVANNPDVLSIVLVKNSDRTIAVQKKFVVTGLTSSGSILIPDSIAAADYSIIAYTNHFIKGRPDELFIQRIAIKRIDQPGGKPQLKTTVPADFSHADSTKINIKFYPEGGDLVAGLPCYVGWEAKNSTGTALKVKGVLLKDGKFIDTVKTSGYGMGKFFINPKYASKYTVKITGNSEGQFDLPTPKDKGVAVTMPAALAHDTLILKVASTLTGKIHIIVHNTMKVFYALANVDPQKGKIFKIALDSLPRGLAAVTIFNEDFKPYAERVFFAHSDKAPILKITSDQAVYGKRKKVTLRFTLNSSISNEASVSVACVRTNRIDQKNFKDIDSYGYLSQSLSSLPYSIENSSIANTKKYLEDVLLVREWRRYTINNSAGNSTPNDTSLLFTGTVTTRNNPVKKPVMLMLFGDSTIKPVLTDKFGKFAIANDELITPKNRPLTLMATGEYANNFRIKFFDPYEQINQQMAELMLSDSGNRSAQVPFQIAEPSAFDSKVMLKQVTIKGNKDDEYNDASPNFTTNACGDYIGPCGVLNCPLLGHNRHTHPPIKGHTYFTLAIINDRVVGQGFVTYQGCQLKNKSTIHFDGINVKKEFYPYEDDENSLLEPLYETTLYWKNQIQLTGNKETNVIFYTGDVKAGYTVIVQGITDNGVLFGEQHFEVE